MRTVGVTTMLARFWPLVVPLSIAYTFAIGAEGPVWLIDRLVVDMFWKWVFPSNESLVIMSKVTIPVLKSKTLVQTPFVLTSNE